MLVSPSPLCLDKNEPFEKREFVIVVFEDEMYKLEASKPRFSRKYEFFIVKSDESTIRQAFPKVKQFFNVNL